MHNTIQCLLCRRERIRNKEKLKKSRDQTHNLLISSQTVLPSEPPDSLMAEEYRIVLIPKLASKNSCF